MDVFSGPEASFWEGQTTLAIAGEVGRSACGVKKGLRCGRLSLTCSRYQVPSRQVCYTVFIKGLPYYRRHRPQVLALADRGSPTFTQGPDGNKRQRAVVLCHPTVESGAEPQQQPPLCRRLRGCPVDKTPDSAAARIFGMSLSMRREGRSQATTEKTAGNWVARKNNDPRD
jgi:hypothetical protein